MRGVMARKARTFRAAQSGPARVSLYVLKLLLSANIYIVSMKPGVERVHGCREPASICARFGF